jgi:hypothetical protein
VIRSRFSWASEGILSLLFNGIGVKRAKISPAWPEGESIVNGQLLLPVANTSKPLRVTRMVVTKARQRKKDAKSCITDGQTNQDNGLRESQALQEFLNMSRPFLPDNC